jgi:hypothetical protein
MWPSDRFRNFQNILWSFLAVWKSIAAQEMKTTGVASTKVVERLLTNSTEVKPMRTICLERDLNQTRRRRKKQ